MEELFEINPVPTDLKLVAVRLDSPGRKTAGSRAFQELDGARPHTTGGGRRNWGGQPPLSARDGGANMPQRFPAREVPPLVRVLPTQGKDWTPPGSAKQSMRQALGPMTSGRLYASKDSVGN